MSADSRAGLIAGEGRTPAVVVLGAPRCGTTATSRWLDDAGLGVGVKDSFYLMDDDAGLRGATHLSSDGTSGYLELFPDAPLPTVDCAAGYLYQRTALDFFGSWDLPPEFAVIVRDPVARLRSVHRYFTGNLGRLPRAMTFEDFVDALFSGSVGLPDTTVSDALRQGCYATALAPWIEAFGTERVHVFSFDDLAASPGTVVARLVDLAGASPRIDLAQYSFETYNRSYLPRSAGLARAIGWARGWMPSGKLRSWGGERLRRIQHRDRDEDREAPRAIVSDTTTRRLREFYAEPNAALARGFGIDIDGWT